MNKRWQPGDPGPRPNDGPVFRARRPRPRRLLPLRLLAALAAAALIGIVSTPDQIRDLRTRQAGDVGPAPGSSAPATSTSGTGSPSGQSSAASSPAQTPAPVPAALRANVDPSL